MASLSLRRLKAINEALSARLAGEIDIDGETGIRPSDYAGAQDWVRDQIEKKEKARAVRHQT